METEKNNSNIFPAIFVLAVVAILLLVYASFTDTEEYIESETEEISVPTPPNLFSSSQHIIGTGNKLGTYYPAGMLLAEWLNSRLDSKGGTFKAFETNGSVDNIKLLSTKSIQLGMSESRIAREVYNSQASSTLRVVWPLWPDVVQLLKPPADLVPNYEFPGKQKGFIGQKNSSTSRTSYEILTALGDNRKHNSDVSLEKVLDAVADAKVGFAMIQAGIPNNSVSDSLIFQNCELISFDDGQLNKILAKATNVVPFTLPKGYYCASQPEIHTIGLPNVLVATSDTTPEFIEFITDNLVTGFARLKGRFKAFETVPSDPDEVLKILNESGVPIHEGTKRWFEKHKSNAIENEAGEAK